MEEYTLVIRVIGLKEDSRNSVSINKVSDSDMEILQPLLEDIKDHKGYFPCGIFVKKGEPTARDLYRVHSGWDVFDSLLPRPESGFALVDSVEFFNKPPYVMKMS